MNTVRETVIAYLKTRKTPASAKEIATFAKVNYNSVRRVLGEMLCNLSTETVRCKVDKAHRTGYTLA